MDKVGKKHILNILNVYMMSIIIYDTFHKFEEEKKQQSAYVFP